MSTFVPCSLTSTVFILNFEFFRRDETLEIGLPISKKIGNHPPVNSILKNVS